VVKNQKGATGGGDEKKEQPVAGTCEGLVGGNEQSTNTFDSDYRIALLKKFLQILVLSNPLKDQFWCNITQAKLLVFV
jgi:hypothetical protein